MQKGSDRQGTLFMKRRDLSSVITIDIALVSIIVFYFISTLK
jgi:hypothetical protein